MPRKVRELISDLKRAGFVQEPARGSHRKFRHAHGVVAIISGKEGSDAQHYQEKHIKEKIREAHS